MLAPDGEHILVSANDWHIYRAPLSGGTTTRVTNVADPRRLHFLHGVNPDGATLAYIGLQPDGDNLWASANVFTIPAVGGQNTTDERIAPRRRIRILPRRRLDLFQHRNLHRETRSCPDGRNAVYLSFTSGTEDHPENLWVDLKIVDIDDWAPPRTVQRLFGGQGTINVNS